MSVPFRALMATSAVMVGGVALIAGAGTALASSSTGTQAPVACPGAGDYAAQKALLSWGSLQRSGGHATITVSLKDSAPAGCGIAIGLASYSAPHATADDIERQVLVDAAGGHASATLTVDLPDDGCFAQVDAFVGPTINSFAGGDRYGDRLLTYWNGAVNTDDANGTDCTSATTEPPTTEVPETVAPTTVPDIPETVAPTTVAPTTVPEVPEGPEGPTTTQPEQPEGNPSTTIPATTEPTKPEAVTTVPTTEAPSDSTAVAPEQVEPTSAVAAQATVPGTGRLPETGAGTIGLLAAGAGALTLGFGLVQLSSRRRSAQAD